MRDKESFGSRLAPLPIVFRPSGRQRRIVRRTCLNLKDEEEGNKLLILHKGLSRMYL